VPAYNVLYAHFLPLSPMISCFPSMASRISPCFKNRGEVKAKKIFSFVLATGCRFVLSYNNSLGCVFVHLRTDFWDSVLPGVGQTRSSLFVLHLMLDAFPLPFNRSLQWVATSRWNLSRRPCLPVISNSPLRCSRGEPGSSLPPLTQSRNILDLFKTVSDNHVLHPGLEFDHPEPTKRVVGVRNWVIACALPFPQNSPPRCESSLLVRVGGLSIESRHQPVFRFSASPRRRFWWIFIPGLLISVSWGNSRTSASQRCWGRGRDQQSA